MLQMPHSVISGNGSSCLSGHGLSSSCAALEGLTVRLGKHMDAQLAITRPGTYKAQDFPKCRREMENGETGLAEQELRGCALASTAALGKGFLLPSCESSETLLPTPWGHSLHTSQSEHPHPWSRDEHVTSRVNPVHTGQVPLGRSYQFWEEPHRFSQDCWW